ncbi:MAG: hypothetical protein Q9219_003947 [cf. Caloplaca sp. 3 TL-2023]
MKPFLCLLILSLRHILQAQAQSRQQHPLQTADSGTLQASRLNFLSPAPHIFSSIHGLLRQGYSTFYPNGFSVATCEIPAFTPLYHGWLNDEPPQSPEWLAFTPEMASGIMGSTRNSFLSTYQTTRSAKCLYFDGASGALGENGTMDTQMLFLYGNTTGPSGNHSAQFLWDEYGRAQHLCEWLREHGLATPGRGIEGIVRMSAGFELIWCDFSSSTLRLASRLNISVPLLAYNRTSSTSLQEKRGTMMPVNINNPGNGTDLPAPDWEIDWQHEPFVRSTQWDWFISASRSYHLDDLSSKRQLGLNLLDAEVVNLYSPEYQDNLLRQRGYDKERFGLTADGLWQSDGGYSSKDRRQAMKALMRRRSKHRTGNLTQQDIATFRDNIKSMIRRAIHRDSQRSFSYSHINDMIVDHYAMRIMHLQRLLERDFIRQHYPPSDISAYRSFINLRERVHALLMPFFDYSAQVAPSSNDDKLSASLDRCKRQYLPVSLKEGISHTFTSHATEEVLQTICSVLISVGSSVETTWLHHYNQGSRTSNNDKDWQNLRTLSRRWHEQIEELTAWLGWTPHWMGCDRACAWDVRLTLPLRSVFWTVNCGEQERCYIPMWPLFRQLSAQKPAYGNRYIDPAEVEHDLWHPRCLKSSEFAVGD